MFRKFMKEKKGDVVQYIIVLAVIVAILVFAFPKIKTAAACAVEHTYVSIVGLIFGKSEKEPAEKNCGNTSEKSEKDKDKDKKEDASAEKSPSGSEEDANDSSDPLVMEGEDTLSEAEKNAMPISHIEKDGLDLTCKNFHSFTEFTIPSTAPPRSIGTNSVKITNNKGWDMWVKVSSVLTGNQLAITSDHSYYRKIPDNTTAVFDIGWKWNATSASANKGQGKVYFEVLCDEPAKNALYLHPKNAPENFIVTKTEDTAISLKWDNVPTTSEYFVFRDGVMVYRGTNVTYTDTNLLPGTTYSYKLYTAESFKNSESTNLSQTTTGTSPIPKTPSNLRLLNKTANSYHVIWNNDGKATHYRYYINGKEIGTTVWGSFITSGLQPNTEVTFGIRAENMYGASDIANLTFHTNKTSNLANPNNFKQVSRTDRSQVITWDPVPDATSYLLKYYDQTLYAGSGTSFEHKNLGPGGGYHYYLYAVNGNEISSGIQKSFTTSGVQAPTVPNTITISNVTNTSLSLKWTQGAGAAETVITMNGKEIYNDAGTSMTVTGLTPNTNYVFGLKSVNSGGSSRVTTVETFTTNDAYDQVSDLAATCQVSDYNKTFTMPTGIKGKDSGIFALNITNNSNKDIAFKVSDVSLKGTLFESNLGTIEYSNEAIIIKPTEVFTVPLRWFTTSSKESEYTGKTGTVDVKVQATC